jgi:uncharacterized protein DUF4268
MEAPHQGPAEPPSEAVAAAGNGAAEHPTTPTGAVPASTPPAQRQFGRLEEVRIRDYWRDEARDFTPWLAKEDNLSLLGETIGLENLELVGMEQRIGPFRADIIARDEDHRVVIENQLDATDHKHLGQLMVYAADRQAHTVVWIARQVSDEYRKVIDWLNRETTTNFWALEIELWRIGESAVAPKFNVVCEPNELTKPTADGGESAELTAVRQLQLEFWTGFADYLDSTDTSLNSRKPRPQNWYPLGIGTSIAYVQLTMLVSKNGQLGCELYIPGRSQANLVFEALMEDKQVIESELGELDWQDLPDRKACRIAEYRQADLEEQEKWPALYEWLKERAEAFKAAFAERLKHIDLPAPEELGVTGIASSE